MNKKWLVALLGLMSVGFILGPLLSEETENKINITEPKGKSDTTFLDSLTIKWTTTGPRAGKGMVLLYYSLNSGRDWQLVGEYKNDGTAKWTVPDVIKDENKVRLKAEWKKEDESGRGDPAIAEDVLKYDFSMKREKLPDLTVKNVTGFPMGDLARGGQYDIEITIANIGDALAKGKIRPDGSDYFDGYYIRVGLSSTPVKEDVSIINRNAFSDPMLLAYGLHTNTEDLTAGQSKTYSIKSVTIDPNTPLEHFYIVVIVKFAGDFREKDEVNNFYNIKKRITS